MLVGIADIYLYTGLTASAGDSHAAFEWLTENDIPFTHLHYADPAQHPSVFEPLNTWFPDEVVFTDFPFVIYDERHDDYTTVRRCIYGLDAIKNSNLVELVALTAE